MTEQPSQDDNEAGDQNQGIPSPQGLRDRVNGLLRDRKNYRKQLRSTRAKLKKVQQYLTVAPKVAQALDALSQQLFEQLVGVLEDKLTIALQEVLEQPIKLRADTSFKYNQLSVDFYIERGGEHEDIMEGQGGSVANILSVGLRMFALTTLDERQHRRFLVLDEQDCWIKPELVPRLVKIVHDAGDALNFQVIMISHHEVAAFRTYADKIYYFHEKGNGEVDVEEWSEEPAVIDDECR